MTDATIIEAAADQAGAITPMLGTVGPMTTVFFCTTRLLLRHGVAAPPTEKSDTTRESF